MQLRRQKHKDAAASGDSSEMTSPSPVMSCDLHELTSSPTSSDSECDQPQGIDEDIFLRPSTYRLPCDTIDDMPPPLPPAPCVVAVNGTMSSSEDDSVDGQAADGILSQSEDEDSTTADNTE